MGNNIVVLWFSGMLAKYRYAHYFPFGYTSQKRFTFDGLRIVHEIQIVLDYLPIIYVPIYIYISREGG